MILDCTTSCGVWQLESCPRFKKNRRAGAPPWSSICDQSQASAIPPPLCSMQCREVKQPWPSPCQNDLPGDILVRDCCTRKIALQQFTAYVICWTKHQFHLELIKLNGVPFIDRIIQKETHGFTTSSTVPKGSCSQQQ